MTTSDRGAAAVPPEAPIVSVRSLRVTYGGQRRPLHAVSDVSLDVHRGEALGIIGESGSGKSTLLRAIAGLEKPSAGSVHVDVAGAGGAGTGRPVQVVFQDPDRALNQRMTIWQCIAEPMAPDRIRIPRSLRAPAIQLLATVGLTEGHADRRPGQLSGGQRQRVTIARALAAGAPVLLLDEPMSGQDVSLQIGLTQLLARLRTERRLTYVIVSHDVGAIAQLADRVGVMYAAKLVELGPAGSVVDHPRHPYTRSLISAVPRVDVGRSVLGTLLEGEPPDLRQPPAGCRFHTRCPFAIERCVAEEPVLAAGAEDATSGHLVACHRWPEVEAQSVAPDRVAIASPTGADARRHPAAVAQMSVQQSCTPQPGAPRAG